MLKINGTRPMIVAVIGSRGFTDYSLVRSKLEELASRINFTIVSGGAKGPDSFAEKYAKEQGIKIQVFKPDWSLGKGAGFIRNTDIVKAADLIIAFWDEKSRGTLDSLRKSKELGKVAFVVNPNNDYYQY